MSDFTERYTIVNVGNSWRLMFGDNVTIATPRFTTPRHAKEHCYKRFGVVPEIRVSGSVPFDLNNATHRAIATIERRHSGGQVISVDPAHYHVRRSRTSSEVPIRYSVQHGMVHARGDAEQIYEDQGEPS